MSHSSNKLTKTCKTCGTIFEKKVNTSKKNWELKQFCSRSCVNKGRPSHWRGKKLPYKVWNKGKTGVQEAWNKGKVFEQIRGEKHYLWKGDKTGLVSQHNWIVRRLGRPKRCDICGDPTRKMYHWSNISGEYKRDVNDYQRLCVPCHKKYDLDKLKKN